MVKYSDIVVGDAFVDTLSANKDLYVVMSIKPWTYPNHIVVTAMNSQTTRMDIYIGKYDSVLTYYDCEYFSLHQG